MKSKKSGMFKFKGLAGVAAFGLAASLAVPIAAYGLEAQAPGWHGRGCGGSCAGYVDADADGVCDNRGFHAVCAAALDGVKKFEACGRGFVGANFIDEDGDGVCDNRGSRPCGGQGGVNYVDADADGVCDNFVDEDGDGMCDGRGGNGGASGYVDADADGVCDNRGGAQGRGLGHHGLHGGCMR